MSSYYDIPRQRPVPIPAMDVNPFNPGNLIPTAKGFRSAAPPNLSNTRYVRKTGSDAADGLTPSTAWQTINKAMTTAPNGTIIYIGAGVYQEQTSPTIAPTVSQPVWFVGDTLGIQTGDVGMVTLGCNNFPAGFSAGSNNRTISASNSFSNVSFYNIQIVSGTNALWFPSTTLIPTGIRFIGCTFIQSYTGMSNFLGFSIPYGQYIDWIFDSCYFFGSSRMAFTGVAQAGFPDWNLGITFRNCLIMGGTNIQSLNSGATSGKPGGLRVLNCTMIGSTIPQGANQSTTIPWEVYGCFISVVGATAAVQASALGGLIEDYNILQASNPRINVPIGAHSVDGSGGAFPPLFYFGQEILAGMAPRMPFENQLISPALGFGAKSTEAGLDIRNMLRPSSPAKWDVGAIQRGNNFVKETGTVHTGSNAISAIGFSSQDFDLPVDTGVLTVSVYTQTDNNYVGPRPVLQVIKGAGLNVGDVEIQASNNSINGWEQISVTINPTTSGVVTVRLISRDTSGVGKCIFDTFSAV